MDVEQLFVGGGWATPQSEKRLTVHDPATEEVFGSAPRAGVPDTRAAVRAARFAFDKGPWPRMTPVERAAALKRFDVEVSLRRQRLTDLLVRETGCTRRDAETVQVGPALTFLAWVAETAARDTDEVLPNASGAQTSVMVREPYGVVAALCSWTQPLVQAVTKVAAALATGNTVVLKPHPATPLSAYVLAECAAGAGLPAGVLNVLSGTGREAGDELVRNPLVAAISLSGSTATGRRVAERAGARLAKTTLILDGDGAVVVCAGADTDAAVRWLAGNWLAFAGQLPQGIRRAVVADQVFDAFMDRLMEHAKGVVVGAPGEWTTDLGPLISADARAKAEASVAAAVRGGATLLGGGGRPEGLSRGYYLEPAVLLIPPEAPTPVVRGPVLAVRRVSSMDEALAAANEDTGALSAAVWAPTPEQGIEIARRLYAGTVFVNGGGTNQWAPAGGYGYAGLGREGGLAGLEELSLLKHLSTGR
jgi:aldehyde dehydrogenase (NAD+)